MLLSWGDFIAHAMENTWVHGAQGAIIDISIFSLTLQDRPRLLR